MNALRLAHSEWLLPLAAGLLLLSFALGVAGVVARRRRARLLGEAGGHVAHAAFTSDTLLLLAAAAIALALLGPRIGERVVRVPASGVDVMFALDVSRSMDAQDVPPSRLARARRAVGEILSRLEPEDRAGLAAYAGKGVLLTPLTPDRGVLLELTSGIDSDLMRPASSDLGAGVRAALTAFESGSERPRLLVVLSDGEDPERRGDLAAAEALRAGVRVLPIALGTEAGATIPDHGVPLLNASGRTVVSRRDQERLGSLAKASDGQLFAADAWGRIDFDAATAVLRRDAGSVPGALVERRVRAVRVMPFAAFAFVVLLCEGLPRRRTRARAGVAAPPARLRRGALALGSATAVLLAALPSPAGDEDLSTLAALEARVRAAPDDPAALVALGAARLERGRRDAAARAFLAAALRARDADAAAIAYYDLGIAHLEGGDLEAARDAFFDALAFDPRDEKARYNLEWTLVALAQQPPPEPPPLPDEVGPEDTPPPPAVAEPGEADDEPAPPAPEPPPMSETQRRRLLERVEDDPGHALRSAARDARESRPRGVPAW